MSGVRFLRVVGARAARPQVLAAAGGAWVAWNPQRGWTCDCDAPDGAACPHVDAVADLLDPRVLTPRKTRQHPNTPTEEH